MSGDLLPWLELTVEELVYLADAQDRDVNALDHATTMGGLLRSPEFFARGGELFRERLQTTDDAHAPALVLMADSCRAIGHASAGCLVCVPWSDDADAYVVTVLGEDLAAQLLLAGGTLAVRPVEGGDLSTALAYPLGPEASVGDYRAISWRGAELMERRNLKSGELAIESVGSGAVVLSTLVDNDLTVFAAGLLDFPDDGAPDS